MRFSHRLTLFALGTFIMSDRLMAAPQGAHHAPEHVPFSVWFQFVNLAILIGLLVYFLRRPLRDYLIKRHDSVKDALHKAERARQEAEARFKEYSERLRALEHEAAAQRAKAEAEAREEAARLVENARRQAEKLQGDAERMIQTEVARSREALRRESIELAITLAQGIVKKDISDEDQKRLYDRYLSNFNPSELN